MRRVWWLAVWAGMWVATACGATVDFTLSDTGQTAGGFPVHRYTFYISGIQFEVNQEVDIRFDPAVFRELLNPVAPSGFDVLVLQPNNPPGAFGDYSALALINHPPLAGGFSVDFTLFGSAVPGPQPFFINQYNSSGDLVSTISSGTTSLLTPEPATVVLGGLGLLLAIGRLAIRRRLRITA